MPLSNSQKDNFNDLVIYNTNMAFGLASSIESGVLKNITVTGTVDCHNYNFSGLARSCVNCHIVDVHIKLKVVNTSIIGLFHVAENMHLSNSSSAMNINKGQIIFGLI